MTAHSSWGLDARIQLLWLLRRAQYCEGRECLARCCALGVCWPQMWPDLDVPELKGSSLVSPPQVQPLAAPPLTFWGGFSSLCPFDVVFLPSFLTVQDVVAC